MLSGPAWSTNCYELNHARKVFAICEVDVASEELRLFLYSQSGELYGQFGKIDDALRLNGQSLGFAMNAGMYHENRAPVGHYLEDGPRTDGSNLECWPPEILVCCQTVVLCISSGQAHVIETLQFVETSPECIHATQSGPMLVIDGKLHPRFLPDSTSRFVRNGVGTQCRWI